MPSQVGALGVPLAGAADEDQRSVGLARDARRLGDLGVAERPRGAEPEGGEMQVVGRLGAKLDHHLDRLAGLEIDPAGDFVAAFLEEGPALGPAVPGVDDQLAVDEKPREGRGMETKAVRSGLLGGEAAGEAGRELRADRPCRRQRPPPRRRSSCPSSRVWTGSPDSVSLAKNSAVRGAFDQRLPAVIVAAFGKGQAIAADPRRQPVPRRHPIVRVQLRRSAAHDLRDLGIGADDGDPPLPSSAAAGRRSSAAQLPRRRRGGSAPDAPGGRRRAPRGAPSARSAPVRSISRRTFSARSRTDVARDLAGLDGRDQRRRPGRGSAPASRDRARPRPSARSCANRTSPT